MPRAAQSEAATIEGGDVVLDTGSVLVGPSSGSTAQTALGRVLSASPLASGPTALVGARRNHHEEYLVGSSA